MSITKIERRLRIKDRIRKKIYGTAEKPRLSVFRSNKNIYVQLINDIESKTLLSVSSKSNELAIKEKITKTEQARIVGEKIAKMALDSGIKEVVFDRNGYLYHGRIKSLAEAARKNGLKY